MENTEIWLFSLGAALAVIGSLSVIILNSIKDQIKALNDSMQDLNKDLREGITMLDRRVTIVEGKMENENNRRITN